jgi:hypothetical protein
MASPARIAAWYHVCSQRRSESGNAASQDRFLRPVVCSAPDVFCVFRHPVSADDCHPLGQSLSVGGRSAAASDLVESRRGIAPEHLPAPGCRNLRAEECVCHIDSIRDELLPNPDEYGGHRRKVIEHLSRTLEELDARGLTIRVRPGSEPWRRARAPTSSCSTKIRSKTSRTRGGSPGSSQKGRSSTGRHGRSIDKPIANCRSRIAGV